MTEAVVVYFFSDPAYKGDLTSAIDTLKERGYRVVKGDNADELLFLLQVGRPVAVIYTLATRDARSSAAYQMVSRRTLDLLVPIFLVGPDEPRDGVVLVMPEGRRAVESHIPFHAIYDFIEKFDAHPPATPSRPPQALHNQTLGKGKTLHSWQGAGKEDIPPTGSIAPRDPRKRPHNQTLLGVPAPEDTSRKTIPSRKAAAEVQHTAEMAYTPPPPPEFAPQVPAQAAVPVETVEPQPHANTADEQPAEAVPAVQPQDQEPPSDESGPVIVDPFASDKRDAVPAPREVDSTGDGNKSGVIKIAIIVSAIIVAIAIGVVVFLAMQPSGNVPEPLPRGATQFPGEGVKTVTPPPATTPQLVSPGPDQAPPSSAVVAEDVEPIATPESQKENGPKQREKVRPSSLPVVPLPSGALPFPGHFRKESATFFFLEESEEQTFLSKLESSGSGQILLIGHPTKEEVAGEMGGLGISRAWAVEKYLIRKGIDPERIETQRGASVEARDEIDDKGWPRNRWVDISIE